MTVLKDRCQPDKTEQKPLKVVSISVRSEGLNEVKLKPGWIGFLTNDVLGLSVVAGRKLSGR